MSPLSPTRYCELTGPPLFSVRRVARLSCTDSCSVAWITIRIGWRGPKFGDGTHCAIGLRGGAWLQADSARASRARRVRRLIGMRCIAARGRGECNCIGGGGSKDPCRSGYSRALLVGLGGGDAPGGGRSYKGG